MKYNLLYSFTALIFALSSFSQKAGVDLTFTAVNNGMYVKLDSIKIMNRSQGGVNVIHWPDTNLILDITPGNLLLFIGYSKGYPFLVQEVTPKNKQLHLFQNQPNPVNDKAEISMFLPEQGTVNLTITDVQGRVLISDNEFLNSGYHSFSFVPGKESIYFLILNWNGISKSIKILATNSNPDQRCILEYNGVGNSNHRLKESAQKNSLDLNVMESGILDSPVASKTYTFQFTTNIPCPGTPTVTIEGKNYNTIQIYSQCWMKENLNVGESVDGKFNQADNGILEKYCYNNNSDSCTKYGGLYQWSEMMQYTFQEKTQGICPPGWHVPSDEEWKVLEGAVDSQFGIGDSEWDLDGVVERGYNVGTNLKTTGGWNSGGNGSDLSGFSGLPSGVRNPFSGYLFVNLGSYGGWWTSTKIDIHAMCRGIGKDPKVIRIEADPPGGRSVRCLRNY